MKTRHNVISTVFMLFLCAVLLSASVFAADPLTITVEDAVGKPGDTVEVEIAVGSNPGIASLGFEVEYSQEALSFESGMVTAAFSGI